MVTVITDTATCKKIIFDLFRIHDLPAIFLDGFAFSEKIKISGDVYSCRCGRIFMSYVPHNTADETISSTSCLTASLSLFPPTNMTLF